MRTALRSLGTVALLAATLTASAQKVDTISYQKGKGLHTELLKPGLKQYLVYFQMPAKKNTLSFSLWVRDVKAGQRNGEQVFTINQQWYSPDSAQYRTYYSVNRKSDFMPLYHQESAKGKTKAYNWGAKGLTGADTIAANTAKDFKLDFALPNYNWNLDIETFEMLPLAEGKTFAINFYDAGLQPPKYTIYKVTGSEILTLLSGVKEDCWKLVTEGKAPNGAVYTQTFWISKKGHEFFKEEDAFGGMYRYKVKMAAAAPDVVKRF